jgi:hypothetical protein
LAVLLTVLLKLQAKESIFHAGFKAKCDSCWCTNNYCLKSTAYAIFPDLMAEDFGSSSSCMVGFLWDEN